MLTYDKANPMNKLEQWLLINRRTKVTMEELREHLIDEQIKNIDKVFIFDLDPDK